MTPVIEAAFAATLRTLKNPAWVDAMFEPKRPIGPEFDALAFMGEERPENWSAARRDLLAALREIRPWKKLAVVTMMCNDAPYIAEFMAHYFAIGADRVFAYTNDNQDSTLDVLRWFEANAPVTLLPMATAGGVDVQHKNYHHALYLLPELRLYEWVAFLDSDEFLLPDARFGHDLPAMLAAAPAATDAIHFPWRWRHWPIEFSPRPGLLAERFPHASGPDAQKSVSRLNKAISMQNVHFPTFEGDYVDRDTNFAAFPRDDYWHEKRRTGEGGWTEHFWGKSFAEFLIKKRRGAALNLEKNSAFNRQYDDFFVWPAKLSADIFCPWPEAMLARTKAELARFAAKPGFAALQAKVERDFAEYVASVEADPQLRATFAALAEQHKKV